ncbi:tetratricopeptide repeat protein [Actinomycetospora termitidis]|uniref:non-specific serine/threonine protein kinase n=1 Tax=Actinomycetospora termitidis TaxID=3053470 RepID=A0ABT7ME28_9PSEU|nr:tetratricopeptide repeat protein [Actinomycetospora sp. Odt1-22]MDL5158920.1 tetratricopeptide repeat protein [Actinomycetospora sp. Odt1-22]
MTSTPCTGCGKAAVDEGVCLRCGLEQQPEAPTPPPDSAAPPPTSPRTSSTGGAATGPIGVPRSGVPDDPEDMILENPALPERKRFCRNPQCRREVGRSRGGRPGRAYGFCQECRWPFDFRPPLTPGTLVARRYEVRGAIGRGGIGWTYLARHEPLGGHHVVLKGVSEPWLPGTAALEREELRALVTADHRNIVKVLDKVDHPYHPPGPDEEKLVIPYIVMDLVRGRTLRQVLRRRIEAGDGPLPPADVCERMAAALDGLGHLHGLGFAYNDLSDDNLMETPDGGLTIIDLGGVTELGATGLLQRKQGFADPTDPPASVPADLFTAGRTALRLTVAVTDFRHAEHGIPDPATAPLLAEQESFDLLLRRTAHADPAERFASAEENADAFRAVAREIRATADGGVPEPGRSLYFGRATRVVGDDPDTFPAVTASPSTVALALPELQIDVRDRHAGRLTTLTGEDPESVRAVLAVVPDPSPESRLVAVRAGLHLSVASDGARPTLDELLAELPDPDHLPDHVWPASFRGRLAWVRGVLHLALGSPVDAETEFRESRTSMPGEAAPKLALAHCAELLAVAADRSDDPDEDGHGHRARALHYFDLVWRTDHAYVGAAFGLARCRVAAGDRAGAERALQEVPAASRHASNAALCALGVAPPDTEQDPEVVARFFERAERLDPDHDDPLAVDERRRALTTIAVLTACRTRLDRSARVAGDGTPATVLGWALTPQGLGRGLEHAHRAAAALPGDRATRDAHVDAANAVRRWSLW